MSTAMCDKTRRERLKGAVARGAMLCGSQIVIGSERREAELEVARCYLPGNGPDEE